MRKLKLEFQKINTEKIFYKDVYKKAKEEEERLNNEQNHMSAMNTS